MNRRSSILAIFILALAVGACSKRKFVEGSNGPDPEPNGSGSTGASSIDTTANTSGIGGRGNGLSFPAKENYVLSIVAEKHTLACGEEKIDKDKIVEFVHTLNCKVSKTEVENKGTVQVIACKESGITDLEDNENAWVGQITDDSGNFEIVLKNEDIKEEMTTKWSENVMEGRDVALHNTIIAGTLDLTKQEEIPASLSYSFGDKETKEKQCLGTATITIATPQPEADGNENNTEEK